MPLNQDIGNGIFPMDDETLKKCSKAEKETEHRFKCHSILGEGTYGIVFKATDYTTNKVSLFVILLSHIQNY